ncbi:unnamed protein product [Adineta steineri]|uniref:Uncharacterized protein n=1 Tax=Adineta steineri TaxID=433720 RepID=A0A819YHS7_9BILA|nr:unnamed protein product [Adineta steineri]
MKVFMSGNYIIRSNGTRDTYVSIYKNNFNPFNSSENLLIENDGSISFHYFKRDVFLQVDTTYLIVVTTYYPNQIAKFSITVSNSSRVILKYLKNPINIQLNYPIKLTSQSPTFDRDSQKADFYYEVFQFNIITNGSYILWSESQMGTFGYIYKDNFDPNQPLKNKLFEHSGMCNEEQFKLIVDLQPQVLRQRQLLRPHQRSPAQWHRSIFIG